jgi:hypothetical protein
MGLASGAVRMSSGYDTVRVILRQQETLPSWDIRTTGSMPAVTWPLSRHSIRVTTPARGPMIWTSGRMTFRLQPNRPARHDMLNNDVVILHHNTLHDSL